MNENSMCLWWEKVKDLDIPMPQTTIIPFTEASQRAYDHLDETHLLPDDILETIKAEIDGIYPVFIRTDQSSAKHSWIKSCFVDDEKDLRRNLCNILEFNLCAGIMGLPAEAFVVREYIEMDKSFLAFQNMPINPERRYFVNDGKILCHHAYWIQEAIESTLYHLTTLPENWMTLLAIVNFEDEKEIQLLSKYASEIAACFKGYWSIDFCKANNETWYFIDMALGKDSWHPEDCKEIIK